MDYRIDYRMTEASTLIDPLAAAARALTAGDVDVALAGYEQVIERNPTHEVTGWLGLAVCLARRRQWSEAVAALDSVLRLAPGCGLAHAFLGAVRFEEGAVDAALDELDLAVALAADDAVVWLKRGEALLRLGRLSDAAADLREAASLPHPDYTVRDYARELLLEVRRELAGSLPRSIPSLHVRTNRLGGAVRAWRGRRTQPGDNAPAHEGGIV